MLRINNEMMEVAPSLLTPRFHEINDNIQLSDDNTKAQLPPTSQTGLIFSSDPLKPYQKFCVKISEISEQSSEFFSVGFTPHDPFEEQKSISSVKICSLKKKLRIKNRNLFFYYTPKGSIHFGIDDEEKGCQHGKVTAEAPLWAFIRLHTPITLEIVRPESSDDALDILTNEVRNVRLISQCQVTGNDDSECMVCCKNLIGAAIYPCGHMCMCIGCAREQWKGAGGGRCPMCRAAIRDVLRIFKN